MLQGACPPKDYHWPAPVTPTTREAEGSDDAPDRDRRAAATLPRAKKKEKKGVPWEKYMVTAAREFYLPGLF